MTVQILDYDQSAFDFRNLALNYLRAELYPDLVDLEDIHLILNKDQSVESVRQLFFDFFRTSEFQSTYHDFSASLIKTDLTGYSIIQKTPTIRVQFPGTLSVSFHTDEWYGHHPEARTLWVPITRLEPTNTLQFCFSDKDNKALKNQLKSDLFTLDQINELVYTKSNPVIIGYGQCISFPATCHHGTMNSKEDSTRISFDFRFVKDSDQLGTKPSTNYVAFDGNKWNPLNDHLKPLRLIMLSNYIEDVSTKNQVLFINAYCNANHHTIVGAESEIISLDYMPVLEKYLTSQDSHYDGVAIFSKEFIRNRDYLSRIGDILDISTRKLVLAQEDVILDTKKELFTLFSPTVAVNIQ